MTGGKWSRWGRGGCEGYSLDLGNLISFSLVRRAGKGPEPHYFEATSHTRKIDTFPTAQAGMEAIEKELEWDMKRVLEDWELYKANKAKRRKS